jgi:hypothetical protein
MASIPRILPRFAAAVLLVLALALAAQPAISSAATEMLPARTVHAADEFQQKAASLTTVETLHQTSFRVPPHPLITVGSAVASLAPRFLAHDIVSEYGIGHLNGSPTHELLEIRALILMDGNPIQTPAVARRALLENSRNGVERIRKHILEEFTKFGLVDVASDYGIILLAFTSRGLANLRITRGEDGYVGTEEAATFDWTQNSGGALEFRGRKIAVRPLHGTIWVRKLDGIPLRITASFEHEEPKHTLRDDATVDYTMSAFGFPVPLAVVHRHYVDDLPLTENLYTYEPFRLFTTDSTIQYTGTPPPK